MANRETTIGKLVDEGLLSLFTGPFGSVLHAHDYTNTGVPVVPTEAIGRRFLSTTNIPCISEKTAARLQKYRIRPGDILFARRGAQATGLSAIALQEHEGWIAGTGTIVLRVHDAGIHPHYLSFWLSSESSFRWLRVHAVGAVMPNLNGEVIGGLPVRLPPVADQKAIADILGTLDDKIELNRRTNETLEAMARAIFKSWFVDFDPVRAKAEGRKTGLPKPIADLFPDSFVDSELGPIPKGWRVVTIGDMAIVTSGKRPAERFSEPTPGAQVPLWGGNGPMAYVSAPLYVQPILLTGRVGTLGSVFRIASPCWPSDNTLVLLANEQQSYEYLFLQLERVDFTSLNRGSTQPLLTQSDLKCQPLAPPPESLLFHFHAISFALFARSAALTAESRTLAALRDALLPKLLSGEIRVADANRMMGRAVE